VSFLAMRTTKKGRSEATGSPLEMPVLPKMIGFFNRYG